MALQAEILRVLQVLACPGLPSALAALMQEEEEQISKIAERFREKEIKKKRVPSPLQPSLPRDPR
jgi:septation ring formation regulator EzrA